MSRTMATVAVSAALVCAIGVRPTTAATDPNVLCQRTVVKQLEKFKKTHLKVYRNCLDKENRGDVSGCLDLVSAAKLDGTKLKVSAAIAKKCTLANLTAVGYRSDCHYGASTAGVGGTCFNMPVGDATQFANCMMCWK